jgi:hypothetical protein
MSDKEWIFSDLGNGAFQIMDADDDTVICHRNRWDQRADQSAAHGRLISSTPTMFSALRELKGLVDESLEVGADRNMLLAHMIDVIDRALMKVEGK